MSVSHGSRKKSRAHAVSTAQASAIDINARVIALYEKHSELYLRDEIDRLKNFKEYKTFFACLKCMDGRVEFPAMTKTARGIVKPYRAMGGKFETFWPAFQNSISLWVKQAIQHVAHNCVFVTSHHCSLRHDLGCKGWDNDAEAAKRYMEELARQLTDDYQGQLVAIPTSIDTAYDALVLHGPRGDISGENLLGVDADGIRSEIRRVFPNMPEQVVKDIVPFLKGNAERVAELKANPRSETEMGHDERVIAIGEGFDGLAADNSALALMNSDVSPNLDDAVVVAAKIIEKKFANHSSSEQVTIFTNIFFRGARGIFHGLPAIDRRLAERRTRGLQKFAQMHIKKHCPTLWHSGRLHFLTGVTDEPTRKLEVIEQGRVCV